MNDTCKYNAIVYELSLMHKEWSDFRYRLDIEIV